MTDVVLHMYNASVTFLIAGTQYMTPTIKEEVYFGA